MSQITEPTKVVLDSAARGIMASIAIAFVWALLFTIGVMTGWFAPWWLWIGLAVIILMAVANMPDEPAKKQEGADDPPTEDDAAAAAVVLGEEGEMAKTTGRGLVVSPAARKALSMRAAAVELTPERYLELLLTSEEAAKVLDNLVDRAVMARVNARRSAGDGEGGATARRAAGEGATGQPPPPR